MSRKCAFAVLIGVFALTGGQAAQEAAAEDGGVKWTAEQNRERMSDRTIPFATGTGSGYYAPDGTFLYKMDRGGEGEGTWSINDAGDPCLQVTDWWGREPRCFEMWEVDGKLYSVDPNGKRQESQREGVAGNQL